jgi:hypothetical protein
MGLPEKEREHDAGNAEKAFDEKISDLIMQRKLQQEALAKIKSSVEKKGSRITGINKPNQKPE